MTRRGVPWRGPSDLERMEKDMDELVEDSRERGWVPRGWPALKRMQALKRAHEWAASPRIDVFADGNDMIVKAEVPGMEKDEIELLLEEGTLTIKGEKNKEEKIEDRDYFYSERYYGAFSKTVELPAGVQADKVSAILRNGVLEIRLPRTEETKKREVKIKVD